jgi:hypothetical protein
VVKSDKPHWNKAAQCTRRWKLKYPKRDNEHAWRRGLKRYGIDAEEYYRILALQGGGCGVCGCKPFETQSKRLAVDHNHITKENRGILCDHCNHAVGQLKDSPERAEALARYLRKYV